MVLLLLVVIHNLYIVCVKVTPDKAQTILIVDAYAVLSFAIARQGFKMIAARDSQIRETYCPMQDEKLLQCRFPDVRRDATTFAGFPQQPRVRVLEGPDHER